MGNMEKNEFQVEIMPTAIQELKSAVRYIAQDSPINAQKFATEIRKRINTTLKSNPNICLPPRNYPVLATAGYKRFAVHTNYSALFVVIGQTVEIRHILHNKRNWSVVVGGKDSEEEEDSDE